MDQNTKRIQDATNAFLRAENPEFRRYWLEVVNRLSKADESLKSRVVQQSEYN